MRQTSQATVAACLLMAALGTLYSWSVFVPFLEAEHSRPRSLVSAIFSVATICFTLGMVLAPRLERAGPVLTRAAMICALASAGLAFAGLGHSYAAVVLGFGVMFGLANGLGYSLSLEIVQTAASPDNRGLLTGAAVASYVAGSAFGSPIFQALLERWGFSNTVLLLAAAILGTGLLVGLLLADGVPAHGSHATDSEAHLTAPSREAFAVLWGNFFFMSLVGMMTIAHAAPILAAFGGAEREIVLAAALVAAGNGVGRISGGWLADRLPGHVVLSGASLLTFLALAAILVTRGADNTLVFIFVVGVCYGCIASAVPAIVAKHYGVANVSRVYGRLFTAWGAAGLIGPFAGGVFFDSYGSYQTALSGAAVAALAALLTGWAYRYQEPGYLRRAAGT